MSRALRDSGFAADKVQIIIDEAAAIDAALALAQPGDLLVIFGDNLTRSWKQVIYFPRRPGAPRWPRRGRGCKPGRPRRASRCVGTSAA
jgi:hypothetical protein